MSEKRRLVVGGFLMTVNDGNDYWGVLNDLNDGTAVRTAECVQDFMTTSSRVKVTDTDLRWATDLIAYSYGGASVKELWHDGAKDGPYAYDLIVFVACVPDVWMHQYYGGLWHKPSFAQRAVAFQVDAVPASCGFVGESVVYMSFDEFEANPVVKPGQTITVDCNSLVADCDPVKKHTAIKDHPRVLAVIAKLFQ